MISTATLNYLARQKQLDAAVLFRNGRNAGAIYLMGYALEFYLKIKISHTLNFTKGFPESVSEFNAYARQISSFNSLSTGVTLGKIREIKNHDLNMLLMFSGADYRIKANHYQEWVKVCDWNPEDRYKRFRYSKARTNEFITAAKQIIHQIN